MCQKCLKPTSDTILRKSLTIKPFQNVNENEYAANFIWFWEKTTDFVVTLHVSTGEDTPAFAYFSLTLGSTLKLTRMEQISIP